MRPLSFFSIDKHALWGSESWEISAVEGSETVLYVESPQERERRLFADADEECQYFDNKNHSETSLVQIVDRYKEKLMGKKVWKAFDGKFPLLVKFINAKDDLSVQVHPSDEMAIRKGYPNGKTEFWYVIDAVDSAYIFDGFREPMNPSKLRSLLTCDLKSHDIVGRDSEWTSLGGSMKDVAEEDGIEAGFEISNTLNRHVAKKGDWYFIPAGRVHSIGSGTYLVEIQQASQLTYRLFDFNRVNKEGQHRKLDIEEAIEAVDYTPLPYDKDCGNVIEDNLKRGGKTEVEKLVKCKYFTSSMIHLKHSGADKCQTQKYIFDFSKYDSFVIIVCTNGTGSICFTDEDARDSEEAGRQIITIKKGDVYLLPAALKCIEINYSADLRILETHIDVD